MSVLAPKQKGLRGPREGRRLHRPCLARGLAEQLASSWPLCSSCLLAWTFQRPPAPEILPGLYLNWDSQISLKGPAFLLPQDNQDRPFAQLCPYPSGSERKFLRKLSCEEDMMSNVGTQHPPLPQPIISEGRKGKGSPWARSLIRLLVLAAPSLGFSSGLCIPRQASQPPLPQGEDLGIVGSRRQPCLEPGPVAVRLTGSCSYHWVLRPHHPFWLDLPSFASHSQPQLVPS